MKENRKKKMQKKGKLVQKDKGKSKKKIKKPEVKAKRASKKEFLGKSKLANERKKEKDKSQIIFEEEKNELEEKGQTSDSLETRSFTRRSLGILARSQKSLPAPNYDDYPTVDHPMR